MVHRETRRGRKRRERGAARARRSRAPPGSDVDDKSGDDTRSQISSVVLSRRASCSSTSLADPEPPNDGSSNHTHGAGSTDAAAVAAARDPYRW